MKFLSLDELLNLADSNKHLRKSATTTYEKSYSRHNLTICDEYKGVEPIVGGSHDIEENTISIHSLEMGLRFLRCFGRLTPRPNIVIKDVRQLQVCQNKLLIR